MSKPYSRQTLVDYCLRSLGAPVVEINVDDDQLGDRLDEAMQFYQEYHADATIKRYRKYKVTATDVTNKYITVPDTYLTITRVLPFDTANTGGTANSGFNVEYQMMLNDVFDLAKPGASMLNYSMTQQHLALIDHMFDGKDQATRFNRHINRLYIETRWGTDLKEDDYIIIEGYEIVVPKTSSTASTYGSGTDTDAPTEATSTKIYNDMFLKRYLTALIKKQWGTNIKKFDGMQLPGGVTMNGQQIYDEANEEIQKIEEEVQLKYEMPPAFYVG